MTQGLFQLSLLFQQGRQLIPCHDIGGTDRQYLLKLTDPCDPLFVRGMVRVPWRLKRALSFYRYALALVHYEPPPDSFALAK